VALAVSPALILPIALDGFGVGFPILAGIIGISPAPLLLAVPADLVVLSIGLEFAAVIFPAALPLTVGAAARELTWTETRGLERLQTVTTPGITHHVGSESGYEPFILSNLYGMRRRLGKSTAWTDHYQRRKMPFL
jgi:hypothetical protein